MKETETDVSSSSLELATLTTAFGDVYPRQFLKRAWRRRVDLQHAEAPLNHSPCEQ